ncbi:MAG: mechanosensitive ion channel family protein [Clostridia bacterium]|nr:mechanosensitive ion channel family protein [Clostridia bacterium]
MKDFFDNLVAFLTAPSTLMSVLRFVVAIVVIIIGCKLVKIFTRKIIESRSMSRFTKTMRTFLGHVIAVCFYIVVVVIGAIILGVELTGFSALLASAGVTIGLALQGSLSNIAGGVMIVGLKPFEVGDYVEGSGVSGTVTDIGIFYTTLTTPDNKKVVVPNGALSNSTITNYSAYDTRRISLDFSVSYKADLALVKKVLYSCAKVDERVLNDPAPVVYVTAHGDHAVSVQLRVWVRGADYWAVNFDLIEQVKVNFDQFGIEIPYQQLDVHMSK